MKEIVSASTRITPQFYDLDPMNVVWHGNYARFFEVGRVALLAKLGYGYEEMKAGGHMWPIIEMRSRFHGVLRYGQRADVAVGLVEWQNRLKINYVIRDGATGQRLTNGYTVQVAVESDTGEMLWETPAIFRDKLAPFLG